MPGVRPPSESAVGSLLCRIYDLTASTAVIVTRAGAGTASARLARLRREGAMRPCSSAHLVCSHYVQK